MINTNEEMLAVMNNQSLGGNIFEQRAPHLLNARTDVDYKLEPNRISSFTSHWPPNATVIVDELVAAGLYYTGPGDRVQCAWCGGGLYNWEAGDIALNEHTKHFPKCPFIEQNFAELVAIGKQNNVTKLSNKKKPKESLSHATEIVKQMGYDDNIIAKGVKMVQELWGKDLTAIHLLDAIYEIESEEMDQSTKSPSDGACNTFFGTEDIKPEDILLSGRTNSVDTTATEQNYTKIPQPTKHKLSDGNGSPFDNAEIQTLCEENKKLKLAKSCKICLDNEVNILFLPCRHLACCDQCGDSVKCCPLCRAQIVATVKTFLA